MLKTKRTLILVMGWYAQRSILLVGIEPSHLHKDVQLCY
jgi:hypothetical protein